MIPERSSSSRAAKAVFFEDVNDIDIYIEDTEYGYEKLYAIIFSRVFHGEYKVQKVFPLGGRNAVLDYFKETPTSDRPSLCIIDGDLLILKKENKSKIGLYELPFYCIENILLNEDAIIDLLAEEDPIKSFANIKSNFNYSDWYQKNVDLLFDLFLEYSISFELNQDKQTVAFPVNKLVTDGNGNLNIDKVKSRIEELKNEAIEKVGEEIYNNTRTKFIENFNSIEIPKENIVSGKDYLLPLLKTRGKSIVKTKLPDINLKQRLARKCNIMPIIKSKEYIRA